jgi:hypothetical protein
LNIQIALFTFGVPVKNSKLMGFITALVERSGLFDFTFVL